MRGRRLMALSNTDRTLPRLLPAVDHRSVPHPLLDLVEIAMVGEQRRIGFFVGLGRTRSGRVVLWRQIGHVDIFDPTVEGEKSTLAEIRFA